MRRLKNENWDSINLSVSMLPISFGKWRARIQMVYDWQVK
jgi:hypothetical protein